MHYHAQLDGENGRSNGQEKIIMWLAPPTIGWRALATTGIYFMWHSREKRLQSRRAGNARQIMVGGAHPTKKFWCASAHPTKKPTPSSP